MTRHHAKVDGNHSEVVDALREVGAAVQSLAMVGNGCPDLLVAYRNDWYLFEVKDGTKPTSHRRLTAFEQTWIDEFEARGVIVYVVTSVDEALEAIGAV